MKWYVLSFPAEAVETEEVRGPLSGRVWRREAGEILWPAREGAEELAAARAALREYAYSAQYQQNPVPLSGNMFERGDWQRWKELPARIDRWWTSWDMTFSDSARADFVVGQVWCASGANRYMVDQFRRRCDLPATCAAVRSLALKYPKCSAHVVEAKANGKGVVSSLRATISGFQEFNPDKYGKKEERANLILDEVRGHNVWLPVGTWVDEFIERAAAFPSVSHDDEIDALSQSLLWYKERKLRGLPGSVGHRGSYWSGAAA